MKKALFILVLILLTIFLIKNFITTEVIYVLFTVDTEKDLSPYLDTYKGIEEGIPTILDILHEYNVKATFFVTGDVALKYPQTILEIKSYGHEIGAHGLYHEDFNKLNLTEKELVVKEFTAILENITGEKVVSFRAPYHNSSTELINVLEQNGYLIEASATPKFSYPYFPAQDDWLSEGNMKILRVPISHTPYYFYPSSIYNASWVEAFNHALKLQGTKIRKIIVVGLHTWEFVPIEYKGQEIYTRVTGNYTYDNLVELLEYLKDKNVNYVTMKQLYPIFR